MLTNATNLPIAFIQFGAAWLAGAGLALASIPIIIHILNRRRFKIVMWAAMEYLLAAMRKNRRRLRFEQLLLLITRCLLLALLGFALAKPGCDKNSLAALTGQRTGLHVFVIDNSCSMSYELGQDQNDAKQKVTYLTRAKDTAKKLVRGLGSSESVMVITAGGTGAAVTAEPVLIGADPEKVCRIIDGVEQSYGGTDIAGALQEATSAAKKQTEQPRRILYLLTDCTRSAFEDGKNSEPLRVAGKAASDEFLQMLLLPVNTEDQWNYAVLDVHPPAHSHLISSIHNEIQAEVAGYGKGPETQVEWQYDNGPVPGGTETLASLAEPKTLTQSRLPLGVGGAHVVSVSMRNHKDNIPWDDTRYRVIDVAQDMRVLLVEGSRGAGALAGSGDFLKMALAPDAPPTTEPTNPPQASDSYIAPEVVGVLDLRNKVLSDYRAVILTNVDVRPTPEQEAVAKQLADYVQQGGALMLFMGDQVNLDNYNKVFLERKLLPGKLLSKRPMGSYSFDFNAANPGEYLSYFQNKPQWGLETADTRCYIQADVPADSPAKRVLNYTAGPNGAKDPAITIHPLGNGQVVFWSTTANADWTDLPAKQAFLQLVHELLAKSVNASEDWMNLNVGESLHIPPSVKRTAEPKLITPDGKQEVPLTYDEKQQVYVSKPLKKPGLYELKTGQTSMKIAVNVPGSEADVRSVATDQIAKDLGDIKLAVYRDSVPSGVIEGDLGSHLGWLAMVAVLCLVCVECFMAMHFGHYRRDQVKRGESGAQNAAPAGPSSAAATQPSAAA